MAKWWKKAIETIFANEDSKDKTLIIDVIKILLLIEKIRELVSWVI